MTQMICTRNKFGHCKFGNSCRNIHYKETCKNLSCTSNSCEKRHPKSCNWYSRYGRCKFSPCSYPHDSENFDFKNNSEIKNLHERLDKFEEAISKLTEKLNCLTDLPFECDKCNHKVGTQKKLRQHKGKKHGEEADLNEMDLNETVEDEIYKASLVKIEELERYVVRLEEKVELLEVKGENHLDEWKEDDDDLESIIKRHTSMFQTCTSCGYEASNKAKLRSHITTAHINKNWHSHQYSLDQKTFDNLSENEKQFLLAGPYTPRRRSLVELLKKKIYQDRMQANGSQ